MHKHFFTPSIALRWVATLGLAASALATAPDAATANAIQVTTTSDDVVTNGNCTLREAIVAANLDVAVDACPAGSGADTILLTGGTYAMAVAGTGEDAAATGDFDVTADLTIDGAGLVATFISAANLDRVFEVLNGSQLTLVQVTIEDGKGTVGGPGGAIRIEREGALTLSTARVRNTAVNTSHAVYALTGAAVKVLSSRIENNQSGGLYLQIGSTGMVRDSSLTGNTADGGAGASVDVGSTLTLVNSTVSGNLAMISGGGLLASGDVGLYNVTLADNVTGVNSITGTGGGIFVGASGVVHVRNSILADNSQYGSNAPDDCSGSLDSGGSNLIEEAAGCTITGITLTNLIGVDPNLGALDNYGGPTLTQRLLAGSPAIDAGWSTGCADDNLSVLLADQRAFLRNGTCDIGAFEHASPGQATATNTPTPTLTPTRSPTATRTATTTRTATRTASSTPTATRTPTASPVPSMTETQTVSPELTSSATATDTPMAAATITPGPTGTTANCVPVGDRACPTPTVTATPLPCTDKCLYLPTIFLEGS